MLDVMWLATRFHTGWKTGYYVRNVLSRKLCAATVSKWGSLILNKLIFNLIDM